MLINLRFEQRFDFVQHSPLSNFRIRPIWATQSNSSDTINTSNTTGVYKTTKVQRSPTTSTQQIDLRFYFHSLVTVSLWSFGLLWPDLSLFFSLFLFRSHSLAQLCRQFNEWQCCNLWEVRMIFSQKSYPTLTFQLKAETSKFPCGGESWRTRKH